MLHIIIRRPANVNLTQLGQNYLPRIPLKSLYILKAEMDHKTEWVAEKSNLLFQQNPVYYSVQTPNHTLREH